VWPSSLGSLLASSLLVSSWLQGQQVLLLLQRVLPPPLAPAQSMTIAYYESFCFEQTLLRNPW
jgi:hypothetical protein